MRRGLRRLFRIAEIARRGPIDKTARNQAIDRTLGYPMAMTAKRNVLESQNAIPTTMVSQCNHIAQTHLFNTTPCPSTILIQSGRAAQDKLIRGHQLRKIAKGS